jgi:hypothetical protein
VSANNDHGHTVLLFILACESRQDRKLL